MRPSICIFWVVRHIATSVRSNELGNSPIRFPPHWLKIKEKFARLPCQCGDVMLSALFAPRYSVSFRFISRQWFDMREAVGVGILQWRSRN